MYLASEQLMWVLVCIRPPCNVAASGLKMWCGQWWQRPVATGKPVRKSRAAARTTSSVSIVVAARMSLVTGIFQPLVTRPAASQRSCLGQSWQIELVGRGVGTRGRRGTRRVGGGRRAGAQGTGAVVVTSVVAVSLHGDYLWSRPIPHKKTSSGRRVTIAVGGEQSICCVWGTGEGTDGGGSTGGVF